MILATTGTTDHASVDFGDSGGDVRGRILYANTGDYMKFETNGSERMRVTSDGTLDLISAKFKINGSAGSSGQSLTTDGNGNISWATSSGSGTISGSGTDNYIPRFNGTSAVQNSSIIALDSGSVGIGTATPGASLHIDTAENGTGGLWIKNAGNGYAANLVQEAGTAGRLNLYVAGTRYVAVSANSVSYFNGGNFGIGTASPGTSTKLQVAGRGLFTGGTHDPADGSPKGLSLTFENNVGVIRALQTAVASYDIAIQPTSGGNVGIGTTAPEARLHVTQHSNAAVRLTRTATDGQVLWFYRGSTASGNVIVKSTGMGLGGGTSENNIFIKTDGNVGIGTNAPLGILSLPGADTTTKPQIRFQTGAAANLADAAISTTDDSGGTNVMIGANQYWSGGSITRFVTDRSGSAIDFGYAGRMKFYTGEGSAAPTERMRIERDGRVGIGTDTPTANLHIKPATGNSRLKLESDNTSADVEMMLDSANSTRNAHITFYNAGVQKGGVGYVSSDAIMKMWGGNNPADDHLCINSAGSVGIGTNAPEVKLTVRQSAQDSGIRLYGHSAHSGSYMNFRVDSGGHTNLETSGGSYTKFDIGSGYFLLTTAANEPIYMDFGGSFYWRDRDASNAVRMSLNSANGALTLNGTLTASSMTNTLGSAVASTNLQTILNGVASKANRIHFQEGGVDRWLLGQGAASETSAFELYNAAGVIAISVNRTSNLVTLGGGLAATSGTFTGANTNAATYATFQRSDDAVSSRIRYDGSTTILFGTSTNHPISFETNATPRLTISNDGKVGINDTTFLTSDSQGIFRRRRRYLRN